MADRIRDLIRNTKREILLPAQNIAAAGDTVSPAAVSRGLAYEEAMVLLNVGAIDTDAQASIQIGSGADGTVTVVRDEAGTEGNEWGLTITDPGTAGEALAATLASKTITVALGTVGNEVQQLDLSSATAGTLDITFDGQTASAVAFDASAADIKTALEALSNIGSGDLTVTATTDPVAGTSGGVFTIEFGGTLADTDVAELTTDDASLTGSSAVSTLKVPGTLDDDKNTASAVASAISALTGVTATASGDGSAAIITDSGGDDSVAEASFSGGDDSDTTIDAVVEDSDDGATGWAEVDSAVDGGAFTTITASGANQVHAIRIRGFGPYVRIKVTVAADTGTPNVFVAAELIGVPKQVN